jgi:hypothetical protein
VGAGGGVGVEETAITALGLELPEPHAARMLADASVKAHRMTRPIPGMLDDATLECAQFSLIPASRVA